MSDPKVIDALAGVPTGERLARNSEASTETGAGQPAIETTEFASLANSEPNLFAEESTDFALPVGGAVDKIREVPQQRFESSIDALGPTFSEALSGSEEERHLSASDGNASYLNAPPGESTQVFMATAGLYRRRRTHRVAATAGILLSLLLVGIVSLDIIGLIEIPGMGLVYRTTGLVDPNSQRGMRHVERELAKSDLPAERRAQLKDLREKLLGTTRGVAKRRPAAKPGKRAIIQEGVKDPKQMSHEQRKLTESVFRDEQKKENRIHLADPEKIQAPNLPDGLDKESIANVVGNNSSSMNLCLTESMRKGERLGGRMDIEVTIAPDGRVLDVNIASNQFRSTEMGRCTVRRIKSWKFPRFNGEPVTVVYPYILQSPI
jgi:hypothetical protein